MLDEFFAVAEFLEGNYSVADDKIIINSNVFYKLLDKNLYIKRKEKLDFYRSMNLIICNSNGYTSVIYDKETKKAKRKIIFNYGLYKTLKKLSDINFY